MTACWIGWKIKSATQLDVLIAEHFECKLKNRLLYNIYLHAGLRHWCSGSHRCLKTKFLVWISAEAFYVCSLHVPPCAWKSFLSVSSYNQSQLAFSSWPLLWMWAWLSLSELVLWWTGYTSRLFQPIAAGRSFWPHDPLRFLRTPGILLLCCALKMLTDLRHLQYCIEEYFCVIDESFSGGVGQERGRGSSCTEEMKRGIYRCFGGWREICC